MPNYCENDLTIIGDDADVKKFMEENIIDNEIDFKKSVPIPDNLDEETERNWAIDNWGTRRFLEMYDISNNMIIFDTAWAPPTEWVKNVSVKYPDLKFTLRYAESGCNFSGIYECQNGQCTADDSDDCGVHFGAKYCQTCETDVNFEVCDTDWNEYHGICTECYDDATITIKNFIYNKKIKQLPRKLACMRMGRNAIINKYIMNKVFIPRITECVA